MIGCLNSDSRLINATVSALSLAYDYDGESVGSLSYSLAQGAAKSFSYQYDENGNIVSEQVTVDGVSADITAYEYDADNQLVSAENSSIKWTYSYDGRGNLTAENEYSVSVNESGEKVYTPIENDTYAYDTAWKDKLTSYNGQTISYDESGNPTSYLGHSLSWTMGRQLASYDNIAYSYNESGIRTRKTVGENTTEFYLNGTNIIYQTDGTSDIYFFYDRNNELVGFKYSGNNYFYVKNAMGDITDIADENGNIVASYTYDPWGSVLSVTGSDTAIGNLNPFRYRSYYYDSDIQMYYLQSRYYDPGVGRFINCDDVNYIGIYEYASSYNSFAYCENEPVKNRDPYGNFSFVNIVRKFYSYITRLLYKKDTITVFSPNENLWLTTSNTMGENLRAASGAYSTSTIAVNSSNFVYEWNNTKSKYVIIHTHGSRTGIYDHNGNAIFEMKNIGLLNRNKNIKCLIITACEAGSTTRRSDNNIAKELSKKINSKGVVVCSAYIVNGYDTYFKSSSDNLSGWILYIDGKRHMVNIEDTITMQSIYMLLVKEKLLK